MRTFIERVNFDVRGFVAGLAEKPAQITAVTGYENYLPAVAGPTFSFNNDVTTPGAAANAGVYDWLGPYQYGAVHGGNEGCYTAATGGARTFRLTDAMNQQMGDKQAYPQDVTDEKALNCVPWAMVAAFCAWDGGRLPTSAELAIAYGSATYPWGTSPAPAGYGSPPPTDPGDVRFMPSTGDRYRANYLFNYWWPASRIVNGVDSGDYTLHIAAPGRFPSGAGPLGHMDMGGNVFDITADVSGTNVHWFFNGSWEGHGIPYNKSTPFFEAVTNKYIAAGARCARGL
jgi:hypothetical protein